MILYLFVIFPKPSTAPNLPCIFLFFYFRIFQKNNLFYFVELFIHGETFSPIIGTFHPYKVVIFIQVVNFSSIRKTLKAHNFHIRHRIRMFFALLVFDFGFVSLNLEIFCTYSRKHWLLWMWLHNGLFHVCKRSYFLKFCCWRAKTVKYGWIMCTTMCHVIFLLWMVILTFFP